MVVFVIGPACAGKSTFIQNNFPDYKVINLYDYQKHFMTVDEVWESYLKCRDDLKDAIKNNENVVLEHTLLKKERRVMYIEAVKEVTDSPIDIYVMLPDIETLLERRKERKIITSRKMTESELEMCDIPTHEDGFNKIEIIRE